MLGRGDLRLAGSTSMALDSYRPVSYFLSILKHGTQHQEVSGTLASGPWSYFEMRCAEGAKAFVLGVEH